jgi:uncharacterized protein (DUF697 family)
MHVINVPEAVLSRLLFKPGNRNIMSEPSERSKHADTIIRNHMLWSMGAGLIPVPIADFFAVSAIQLDMVRQLCKLYEIDFKENEMKAIITALTGSGLAKAGARAAIKFVPGLGSVIGGVAMSVLSGGSSYALGEVFKRHFETGGTVLDLDLNRLKKVYNEKFEKGKKVAQDLKEEQNQAKRGFKVKDTAKPSEDPVEKIRELANLRKDGLITDEEYERMKKKVLGDN